MGGFIPIIFVCRTEDPQFRLKGVRTRYRCCCWHEKFKNIRIKKRSRDFFPNADKKKIEIFFRRNFLCIHMSDFEDAIKEPHESSDGFFESCLQYHNSISVQSQCVRH